MMGNLEAAGSHGGADDTPHYHLYGYCIQTVYAVSICVQLVHNSQSFLLMLYFFQVFFVFRPRTPRTSGVNEKGMQYRDLD